MLIEVRVWAAVMKTQTEWVERHRVGTDQLPGQALLDQNGNARVRESSSFSPWFCHLRTWFPLGGPSWLLQGQPVGRSREGGKGQGRPQQLVFKAIT